MSLFRVTALLVMCGIVLSAVGKSATAQNSATEQAVKPDDIPKSIAESVSGTLQFAEGTALWGHRSVSDLLAPQLASHSRAHVTIPSH